ncbi:MAG: response regulator transcription factor [Gammaproteobacteria bacterium]|nr:response regulator transcription factor [Gammaproteobacteria bacterium]MBU1731176.1 response regulator transcription factor [Gammaproteobacteria bacterium]MBU1891487.1 response regulator transcription factor [Gammaproteobacteria bacterium]
MQQRARSKYKVAIVDDHPIVRQGIAQLIDQEEDMVTCCQAGSAQEAIEIMDQHSPDILLVDISLDGISGIELIKLLKQHGIKAPVLIISMHDESLYAERALRSGARGYVMKQEATEKVLTAIRQVLRGEIYLSERMQGKILQRIINGDDGGLSGIDLLSDRELEVFRLIGHGYSTSDIGRELKRSVKTVETHRAHLKDKLGLKNAAELTHFAVQWIEQEKSNLP